MRSSLTAAVGFGALGLSSGLSGCASPDATPRLPLPNNSALYSPTLAQAGRPESSPAGSGVVQATATATQTPPTSSPGNAAVATAPGSTTPPVAAEPPALAPVDAVRFALENNPSLMAIREQRGFAQGAVVMARTYQYNPIAQLNFFGAVGEGVTMPFTQAQKVTLDVELFGQRGFRKQAASALVTRTEWDIATQELLIAVAANRAYNTVLYRQRKFEVLEDTVKINEKVVEQVKKLVELGQLRPADLIVARTELDAATAQLGQGRTAIAFARSDLRRQFGTLDDAFTIQGELDLPIPTTEFEVLANAALQKRPDLQSRKAMVAEVQAQRDLRIADRYGNPNIGPLYDTTETGVRFYGVQVGGPIPIFNQRTGEILQAKATVAQATRTVRQFEVQATQDVQAALARYLQARKWADEYATTVLPNLRKALADVNTLLAQNEPGVDVLKVIGVQRNYLTSFSAYLDALYEVSQARADLAAAVGDPAIALGLYAPAPPPDKSPAPQAPEPKPPAP